MKHDRNKLRVLNWIKAVRKQKICQEIYGCDFYDNLHQYHKNKIHNSYLKKYRVKNSFSNEKRILKMNKQIEDFYLSED